MPQTAVVLGGSSDLARSLLLALAKRRLESVVLCGRDEARLAPVADELRNAGVKVTTERFDARAASRGDEVAERARAALGVIDLVVVTAGDLGTAELDALDSKVVTELLAANFVGPAAAMTSFAKILREQGSGLIVVYSSVAGLRVRRSNFPYGSAKA